MASDDLPGVGWQRCSLGDVIELKRGYDLPKRLRKAGPVPVVSSSGPSGWHDEAKVRGPGVVTGRYGTIGQVFFVEGDFWPLNTALYIRDFKGADPRFVSYFLETIRWSQFTDKAAVPGVNRNHVHMDRVLWPPVEEQRRISAVLGALDDKIELIRKMSQTLEATAQALFKSWFVDFDPVIDNALRAGNAIPDDLAERAEQRREVMARESYNVPGYARLFPSEFEEAGFGSVPHGWEVTGLQALVEFNPRLSLARGTEAVYVEMKVLPTSGPSVSEWTTREYKGGARFQQDDTLLARITPCLENGKSALVDFLEGDQIAFGSTEYIVLRPREGVPRVWPYCIVRYEPFRAHAIASMTGSSGRQRATVEALEGFQIAVPPAIVLAGFGAVTEPLFQRITANVNVSRTLAALRDTLLSKLISGELRVPESAVAEDAT